MNPALYRAREDLGRARQRLERAKDRAKHFPWEGDEEAIKRHEIAVGYAVARLAELEMEMA